MIWFSNNLYSFTSTSVLRVLLTIIIKKKKTIYTDNLVWSYNSPSKLLEGSQRPQFWTYIQNNGLNLYSKQLKLDNCKAMLSLNFWFLGKQIKNLELSVGYRSIEAFKCYYGSWLTPSFRRSTASSGRTITYLRYDFKRRINHSLKS